MPGKRDYVTLDLPYQVSYLKRKDYVTLDLPYHVSCLERKDNVILDLSPCTSFHVWKERVK
jgi:hypothetical protein